MNTPDSLEAALALSILRASRARGHAVSPALRVVPGAFLLCTVQRRKLVAHGSLNLASGQLNVHGPEAWVSEPCDAPLFSTEERTSGQCRSCATGWTHPHNYRVGDAS